MFRLFSILLLFSLSLHAQTVFHTEDLEHFYEAFDKVFQESKKEKQLEIVQSLYLDRGTAAIAYTVALNNQNGRTATAQDWLSMMIGNKDHFQVLRERLKTIEQQKMILEKDFQRFKSLYPSF